jgi:hypothetical protein
MGQYDEKLKALVDRLCELTGLQVYARTAQDGWSIQYGHSRIFIGGRFPNVDGEFLVRGRMEGGAGHPTTWMDLPLEKVCKSTAEFFDWAVPILKAGRTCEVGQGIGVCALMDRGFKYIDGVDQSMRFINDFVTGQRESEGSYWRRWNLNPAYQRGAVWTDRQASLFIGHLLEGGKVNPIFVQRYDSWKNVTPEDRAVVQSYCNLRPEVIDGQQRCRAIAHWFAGEIPAEVSDGRVFWACDMNENDYTNLPDMRVVYVDWPLEKRLRFYIKFNCGGTAHTDADLEAARKMLKEIMGGND